MPNKSKLGLIILTFTLMINLTTLAFSADNPASTGLSFLKLGAGSRAVGMGEAYTALADEASGTYWNPAGLTNINGTELIFTHNQWLQDIKNEFVAIGFRAANSTFGISFMSNTAGGIEQRVKASEEPIDVLTARDIMLGLSFARGFGSNISYGLTVKYLYQKIYVESSNGFAVDAGLQYTTPVNGLKAGFALQNFGYMSKLQKESTKLPQTMRLGLAYQLPFQILQGNFLIASDWVQIFESTSHINLGLEYNFINYFALRFGFQTGYDDKGLHAGFGVNFSHYQLDYAYVPFTSDLGNSHRISVGVKF